MIDELIQSTLSQASVPVGRIKGSRHPQYITWILTLEKGELHGDGQEKITGYYIHVNIWSKGNFNSLASTVKENMLNAGFICRDERDGPYDYDTKYYNRVQRYYYTK